MKIIMGIFYAYFLLRITKYFKIFINHNVILRWPTLLRPKSRRVK